MANVKISALPPVTTVVPGTDVLPLVSGGVTTKATPSAIVTAALVSPGPIGGTTPAAGSFTTLSASSTVSGAGFSTYLASPPAIGGTTPAAGSFTNLSYTGTLTGSTGVINIGSGQIYKDASGNLGLGVTPASSLAGYKFFELGSSGVGIAGGAIHLLLTNNANYISGWKYALSGQRAARYDSYNGEHSWYTAPSGTAGNAITFTQAMTLDASGNLLVGTTTANGKISLYGAAASTAISIDGTGRYKQLETYASGTRRFYIGWDETSLLANITVEGSNPILFSNGGSERARIDSSGNLLVGTPTSQGNVTIQQASSTTGGPVLSLWNSNASGGNTCGYLKFFSNTSLRAQIHSDVDSSGTYGGRLIFSTGEGAGVAERARITSAGVFQIANLAGSGSRAVNADASGNLSAASDSSLKQEEKTASIPGIKEILKITPRAYKWLSDIDIRGEEAATEIGFFADEVAPIIPSAAPKCADGLYGFYDRSVTAALVKAVQELHAEIEQLKFKLN